MPLGVCSGADPSISCLRVFSCAQVVEQLGPLVLNSIAPGHILYTAPEARTAEVYTEKIDIYSFGVLLVECCLGEPPVAEAAARAAQAGRAAAFAPALAALISGCLEIEVWPSFELRCFCILRVCVLVGIGVLSADFLNVFSRSARVCHVRVFSRADL